MAACIVLPDNGNAIQLQFARTELVGTEAITVVLAAMLAARLGLVCSLFSTAY